MTLDVLLMVAAQAGDEGKEEGEEEGKAEEEEKVASPETGGRRRSEA